MKKIKFGFTFSQKQAKHLGLDIGDYFQTMLNLKPAYVRLCAYWDQIQPQPETLVMTELLDMLQLCDQVNQKVILCIGIKAPRWPEFHTPDWFESLTPHQQLQAQLKYVEDLVRQLKSYACISYWQIENEPFDPSGPNRETVPNQVLIDEIHLIKKIDSRPLVVTFWGNQLQHQAIETVSSLVDIIGLDLYYKQYLRTYLRKAFYSGPDWSEKKLGNFIKSLDKPVWITELQAEPWEASDELFRSPNPQSMSIEILKTNLTRAYQLPVDTILFWGIEYWLWKQEQGDSRYTTFFQSQIKSY